METVVCPNCETEIPISNRMPTEVKCSGCGMEFGIEYEPDNPTFKEKARKFYYAHEKQIIWAALAVGLVLKGYFSYQDAIESNKSDDAVSSATNASYDSMSPETYSETISEKPESSMDLSAYDAKTIEHPVSIRNLPENRFPSMEKVKQAYDMGIDLGLHQTIVDSYPQRHYTKKTE